MGFDDPGLGAGQDWGDHSSKGVPSRPCIPARHQARFLGSPLGRPRPARLLLFGAAPACLRSGLPQSRSGGPPRRRPESPPRAPQFALRSWGGPPLDPQVPAPRGRMLTPVLLFFRRRWRPRDPQKPACWRSWTPRKVSAAPTRAPRHPPAALLSSRARLLSTRLKAAPPISVASATPEVPPLLRLAGLQS